MCSFSQRTISIWNKLCTDLVTASSVNMFKNKVDTFLGGGADYTSLSFGPLLWMAILLKKITSSSRHA